MQPGKAMVAELQYSKLTEEVVLGAIHRLQEASNEFVKKIYMNHTSINEWLRNMPIRELKKVQSTVEPNSTELLIFAPGIRVEVVLDASVPENTLRFE